jgi:hypothetical protein
LEEIHFRICVIRNFACDAEATPREKYPPRLSANSLALIVLMRAAGIIVDASIMRGDEQPETTEFA